MRKAVRGDRLEGETDRHQSAYLRNLDVFYGHHHCFLAVIYLVIKLLMFLDSFNSGYP